MIKDSTEKTAPQGEGHLSLPPDSEVKDGGGDGKGSCNENMDTLKVKDTNKHILEAGMNTQGDDDESGATADGLKRERDPDDNSGTTSNDPNMDSENAGRKDCGLGKSGLVDTVSGLHAPGMSQYENEAPCAPIESVEKDDSNKTGDGDKKSGSADIEKPIGDTLMQKNEGVNNQENIEASNKEGSVVEHVELKCASKKETSDVKSDGGVYKEQDTELNEEICQVDDLQEKIEVNKNGEQTKTVNSQTFYQSTQGFIGCHVSPETADDNGQSFSDTTEIHVCSELSPDVYNKATQSFCKANSPATRPFSTANSPATQSFSEANSPATRSFSEANSPATRSFSKANSQVTQSMGKANSPCSRSSDGTNSSTITRDHAFLEGTTDDKEAVDEENRINAGVQPEEIEDPVPNVDEHQSQADTNDESHGEVDLRSTREEEDKDATVSNFSSDASEHDGEGRSTSTEDNQQMATDGEKDNRGLENGECVLMGERRWCSD